VTGVVIIRWRGVAGIVVVALVVAAVGNERERENVEHSF